MAGSNDATVKVQALDGQWETLGSDRARGIVPEGIQYTHDTWGSGSASFTLKRDPGVPWPDLSAFTPVDIHVGGVKTWSGRVTQTPTTDSPDARQVSVQCSGWQYHLDDDCYEGKYVHTTMSDWRNARSFPDANLSNWKAVGDSSVSNDNGIIILGHANGLVFSASTAVGVILDLGPNNTAAAATVYYESSNNHAGSTLFVRGATSVGSIISTVNDVGTAVNNAGTPGVIRGTFPTASRYVGIFLYDSAGSTPAADVWFRIQFARIFSNDSYRSTDASVLKSSHVVSDALTRAPLLSTDTSKISTSSFSIPDYAPEGYRTPREHITAVNAYENYAAYVDVDQRLVYASRDTSPVVEAGAWSGVTFEDASTNSAENIYNRVLLEGTGPDGQPLAIARHTAEAYASQAQAITSPAFTNPGFEVDASGWTATGTGSSITRATGGGSSPDTGVGFGLWDLPASSWGMYVEGTTTGTFQRGKAYLVSVRVAAAGGATFTANTGYPIIEARFGDLSSTSNNYGQTTLESSLTGYTTIQFAWIPTADVTTAKIRLMSGIDTGGFNYLIDTLTLSELPVTLVDRRRFRRSMILPVSSAMTTAGAQKIADTYLTNHRTTPLKGSLRVSGPTGVRRVLGGASVHPSQLGLLTNQVIRLAHRIDFDTGAVGKDGTIVSVSYSHDGESASVEIDNSSSNFESLLSRLAVNVGQLS